MLVKTTCNYDRTLMHYSLLSAFWIYSHSIRAEQTRVENLVKLYHYVYQTTDALNQIWLVNNSLYQCQYYKTCYAILVSFLLLLERFRGKWPLFIFSTPRFTSSFICRHISRNNGTFSFDYALQSLYLETRLTGP